MAVTYKGDILELQGSKWDLPRDLPIEQACNWIEEQWIREEMERAAAAIEEDMESEAAIEAEVPPPPAAQATPPPPAQATPQSIGAADAIAISQALVDQREQAREAALSNQKILDQIHVAQQEVAAEKEQILTLTRSNQHLMNQAFTSFAKRLKDAQVELEMLHQQIGSLKRGGS